jgi:hypothetical protein
MDSALTAGRTADVLREANDEIAASYAICPYRRPPAGPPLTREIARQSLPSPDSDRERTGDSVLCSISLLLAVTGADRCEGAGPATDYSACVEPSRETGFVTPAIADVSFVGKMADEDIVRSPPLPTSHCPARAVVYLRFALSFRDVEDLLAERGLDVSYETVR